MANHLGANQLPITVHEKLNNTVLPKKKWLFIGEVSSHEIKTKVFT